MNLTWHIVKKDLRALRWPLAAWTLLIILKLGVGVTLLSADGTEEPAWFTRLDALSKLFAGMEGVSFVLAAALIHEDLLVGTTAFWMTRPISGARLLRAKLLGIGLVFGLLPVLVTLPWWLGCGYGLREIAWAAAETVAIQAIIVLAGLLWAVVSDGFARFLMWALVTLCAIFAVSGVIGMHLSMVRPAVSSGVMSSRVGLAVTLAVLGIVIVVVHQFLTRRTSRSIGVIITTAALIVMVALWWPWNWMKIEDKWNAFVAGQVEADWPVAGEPAGLKFIPYKNASIIPNPSPVRPGRPVRMEYFYNVQGLPESQALVPYVATYTLGWPDASPTEGWSWVRSPQSTYGMMNRKVLNSPPPPVSSFEGRAQAARQGETYTSQSLPAEVADRLQVTPAAYALKVRYGVMEIDAMDRVPFEPGKRALIGSLGERIAHVEKEGEQLLVTFIRHHPSLGSDFILGTQHYALWVGRDATRQFPSYLLVNRARDFSDRGHTEWGSSTRVGTVEISWQTLAYKASQKAGGARPSLEAIDAINEAELFRFSFKEKARFTHEIKVDALAAEVRR